MADSDKYRDVLLLLKNGTRLVTRILTSDVTGENGEVIENVYFLYRPFRVITGEDGSFLGDWVPESEDNIVVIPKSEVLTACTPKDSFLDVYYGEIGLKEQEIEFDAPDSIH